MGAKQETLAANTGPGLLREHTGFSLPHIKPVEIIGAQILVDLLGKVDKDVKTVPSVLATLNDNNFWKQLSATYDRNGIQETLTPQRTQNRVGGNKLIERLSALHHAYTDNDPRARQIIEAFGGDSIISELTLGVANTIIAADLFALPIEGVELKSSLAATQLRMQELVTIPVSFQDASQAKPYDVLLSAVLKETFVPTKAHTTLGREVVHMLEDRLDRTVDPMLHFFDLVVSTLLFLANSGSQQATAAFKRLMASMESLIPDPIGQMLPVSENDIEELVRLTSQFTVKQYHDLIAAEQNTDIADHQRQRWGMNVSEQRPSEIIQNIAKKLDIVSPTSPEFDVLCACVELTLTRVKYDDGDSSSIDNVWNKLAKTPHDQWQAILDVVGPEVSRTARKTYIVLSPEKLAILTGAVHDTSDRR